MAAVVLSPRGRRGRRGGRGGGGIAGCGFEAQDTGANDFGPVARANDYVFVANRGCFGLCCCCCCCVGQEEVVVQRLGEVDVADCGVADGEKVRHADTRGEGHGEACIAVVRWAARPGELVGYPQGEGEPCEENGVHNEAGGGALALLGDGVGDELEGVDFVIAGSENVEG